MIGGDLGIRAETGGGPTSVGDMGPCSTVQFQVVASSQSSNNLGVTGHTGYSGGTWWCHAPTTAEKPSAEEKLDLLHTRLQINSCSAAICARSRAHAPLLCR